MEWSNKKVLEFIDIFQTEPCLWNLRLPSHKNRSAQSDAWRRIINSLSFEATQEELKKKKESLMGYYRIHLNRYKKSLKSDDVYITKWFAFDAMHSFLRPIYETNSTFNMESTSKDDDTEETTSFNEVIKKRSISETDTGESLINDDEATTMTSCYNMKNNKRPYVQYTSNSLPESVDVGNQMREDLGYLKSIPRERKKEFDEYDYFAFVIASKIRKINDTEDREILMNSIQNLTFEFYMKDKHKT